MMNRLSLITGVLFFISVFPTYATTLYFKNGDKLSGTLKNIQDKSLTFSSKIDGDIQLDSSRLSAIDTSRPITVKFESGKYFTGFIDQTGERTMQIKTENKNVIQEFSIDDIQRIFLRDPREVLRDKLEVKLSGSVNAGFNRQSGNTNKEGYHFDGKLRARTPDNRYTIGLEYNQEQTDDVLSEENSVAFGKYDHFLGKKWYLFSSTTLSQDTFQNLSLQSNVSIGGGYQLYETSDQFLLVELGGSFTNESYEDTTPAREYFGARYAVDYEQALGKLSRFFHYQEGFIGSGEGDFNFRSRTGFKVPLSKNFESTLQLNLNWDQEPTSGNPSTDRQYLFTLGYSF